MHGLSLQDKRDFAKFQAAVGIVPIECVSQLSTLLLWFMMATDSEGVVWECLQRPRKSAAPFCFMQAIQDFA